MKAIRYRSSGMRLWRKAIKHWRKARERTRHQWTNHNLSDSFGSGNTSWVLLPNLPLTHSPTTILLTATSPVQVVGTNLFLNGNYLPLSSGPEMLMSFFCSVAATRTGREERNEAMSTTSPKFELREALLMADALNGVILDAWTKHLLWLSIEDAIRTGGLDRKWGVGGAALVERLRSLTPVEQGMIAYRIQQVWENETYHTDSLVERVKKVGLVAEEIL